MPSQVRILNLSRPKSEPLPARFCDSFLCRLRGLMFRKNIPTGWGLLLVERKDSRVDTAIHMFFVPFDLAVVWINQAGQVVDVKQARAWRPFYAPAQPARYTLEMHVAHLDDFAIGDRIAFETVE